MENNRAVGHQGLHKCACRHGAVARNKETFDVFRYGGVLVKFSIEKLRDEVARNVVGGGSESAGGDDKVGAEQGFTDGFFDVASGVWHGDLPGDGVAKICEPMTNPLLMGVEHTAEQKFGAGVDEFDVHGANLCGEA